MEYLNQGNIVMTEMLLELLDAQQHVLYLQTLNASEGLLIIPRYAERYVEMEEMMDNGHAMMETFSQVMVAAISVQLSKASLVLFQEELAQ